MTDTIDLNEVREQLAHWFSKQFPQATEITVSPLKAPGSGSSNETFFFQLDRQEGGETYSQDLVIRWPPKGFLVFPEHSYDMKKQYRLLQCLADTPIPTAQVYWMEEDSSILGAPFYIMERVDGWVPGDFPPYHIQGPLFAACEADRAKVWRGAIDTMIEIHALDWQAAGLDFLGRPTAKGFIETQVAFYDEAYQQNDESLPPILAATREWLLDNNFSPTRHTLCWGDARLGNMVFRDYEVAAALDWEMACIGDPESDLAWFAHIDWACSEGRPTDPFDRMAGLPSIEETIAYYERKTNRKVENFSYYDVFATWRMAIVYTRIEQDARYLARSGKSKEMITRTHFEKLQRLIGI